MTLCNPKHMVAAEIQEYADQQDMHCIYASTKDILGPIKSMVAGFKDLVCTTILTDTDQANASDTGNLGR